MDMNEWNGGPKDVDPDALKAMDSLIQDYKAKRDKYDEEKKKLSKLWEEVEEAQGKAVDALKASGRFKWQVEGLGTFSIVNKMQVTTPKTNDQKTDLFKYIREKYGADALTGMLGIHSGRLNSFFNEEFKNSGLKEKAMFSLPGIDPPTVREEVRFRKG